MRYLNEILAKRIRQRNSTREGNLKRNNLLVLSILTRVRHNITIKSLFVSYIKTIVKVEPFDMLKTG